jgi:F-type H+-transporting ATPase subunit b
MLIDWFTVGAQALNFIILVWLLKRYLYKPILGAVDAREQRIAAELADAAAKMAEAQKERDEFQRKNEAFEHQRAARMSKVTDEAQAERERLLGDARKAADALSSKRQETLANDARNLNDAIRRRTQQEVFAIARKALTDLASASLEQRMCEVFITRLRALDGKVKASLGEALKAAAEPALVRSAFDLAAEQRSAIEKALDDGFAAKVDVRYETAPAIVSGIELSAAGQKFAWSIADYLASLEKAVDALLDDNNKTQPVTKPQPKTSRTKPARATKPPKPKKSKPAVKHA